MTVYLKGLYGRADQIEHHVKSVEVLENYIVIEYEKGYCEPVKSVMYYNNEMEIQKVTQ